MRLEYLLLRQTELNCMVHINPELEVLYVEKGTVFVKDELQTFPVSQGEAALILPYRLHGFSCDEAHTKATVFMFSFSIAEDFYNAYKMQFFQSKKFKINSSLSAFVAYSLGQFLEKEEGCTIKSIFLCNGIVLFTPVSAKWRKKAFDNTNSGSIGICLFPFG